MSKEPTNLYCVCIFNANDTVTPITHNVSHEIAKSIRRHYNRIIAREITNPMDDTCCMMFSQDYCTNWKDFIARENEESVNEALEELRF